LKTSLHATFAHRISTLSRSPLATRHSSLPAAFTLTELLVILAVIALLAGLAWAGVSNLRTTGRAMVCQGNGRQLMAAWNQFATDHHDRLVNNLGPAQTLAEIRAKTYGNWVNNVMTWSASDSIKDSGNTNTGWVKAGAFSRYTGGSVSIYKCPDDTALSPAQKKAGWTSRLRSVSMNAYLGPSEAGEEGRKPSQNQFDDRQPQILKTLGIPQPSQMFVTLDENANSINDGCYVNKSSDTEGWTDAPASYHNGACTISFADGHVELHRWRGEWVNFPSLTTIPNTSLKRDYPLFRYDVDEDDFNWLWRRTVPTPANSPLPGWGEAPAEP
jgi:prepilin-type processing-associated H-X9-DG protein